MWARPSPSPDRAEALRSRGLRALPRVAVAVLLAACGAATDPAEGDATRYTRALVESADYAAAKAECAGISEARLQGDCRVSVMEIWGVLDEAECSEVSEGVWFDECLFLLAERQRAAGQLQTAIDTCNRTRFARKCAWHLVQDEAQASLGQTAAEAEARLHPFTVSRAVPDAADQFWFIRFQEAAADGTPADETTCSEIGAPTSCQEGFRRYVRSVLDAASKARLDQICEAEPGQRVSRKGEPVFVSGPIADQEEQAWVEARCTHRGGMPRGGGRAPETIPNPSLPGTGGP